MKYFNRVVIMVFVISVTGCANVGQQSTFKERMRDNFLFTSAEKVPENKIKCIRVDKTFSYKSGDVTITLPAGTYKGRARQDGGVFYYAPSSVKTSSFFAGDYNGLYLKDNTNQGNLAVYNPMGYSSRPIRGPVLPPSVFKHIKRQGKC